MDPITPLVERYGSPALDVHADVNTDPEGTWHLESHEGTGRTPARRAQVGTLTPWCRDCAWQVLSQNEEGVDLYELGNLSRLVRTLQSGAPLDVEETVETAALVEYDLNALRDWEAPVGIRSAAARDVAAGERLLLALRAELTSERAGTWLHETSARAQGGRVDELDDTPTLLSAQPPRGHLARGIAAVLEARAVRNEDGAVVVVVPRVVADEVLHRRSDLGYSSVQAVTLKEDDTEEIVETAARLHTPPAPGTRTPTQSLRKALEVARRA